ncbi:MAG: rhombosortase [Gammaproteobacteria bacterium]|nr:rhombosortase [Gammaproteobacteria bacterium]MDH3537931.1 rhombosortase [Gammaproteobacteria bacterium]
MWERIRASSDWRFVGLSLVIFVLFQLIGEDYFRYQRDWVSTGEVWRLETAHWVHVGWTHLVLNALGLAICVSLTRPNWSVKRWFVQSLCIGLGISILCTLQNPNLNWYVGFSGILFGLYFLAAHDLYARDRLIALLIAGAIVGKVILEQYTPYDFTSAELIGAPVITDAHLYGLLMAIAIALVWSTYTMNHRPTEQSN